MRPIPACVYPMIVIRTLIIESQNDCYKDQILEEVVKRFTPRSGFRGKHDKLATCCFEALRVAEKVPRLINAKAKEASQVQGSKHKNIYMVIIARRILGREAAITVIACRRGIRIQFLVA